MINKLPAPQGAKGHWFCLVCDDVVFMTPPPVSPTDAAHDCPVCHHKTAMWITPAELAAKSPILRKLVSDEDAAAWFKQMRETANKANSTIL